MGKVDRVQMKLLHNKSRRAVEMARGAIKKEKIKRKEIFIGLISDAVGGVSRCDCCVYIEKDMGQRERTTIEPHCVYLTYIREAVSSLSHLASIQSSTKGSKKGGTRNALNLGPGDVINALRSAWNALKMSAKPFYPADIILYRRHQFD